MSNKKLFQIGRKTALAMGTAVALGILAWPAAMPAFAQPTTSPSDVSATEEKPSDVITIEPGKAKKLSFDEKIKKANILLPDVADVIPLEPNELLITAKKAGTTQLILWDENDHTQILNIEVSTPLGALEEAIAGAVSRFQDQRRGCQRHDYAHRPGAGPSRPPPRSSWSPARTAAARSRT